MGVEQSGSIRHYAFAEVEKDLRRSGLSVSIDVSAIRQYGIPLQELPLLCSVFLTERRKEGSVDNVTYGEAQMIKENR